MGIHVDYMEIKGFKFLINRIRRADLINRSVNLQVVVIYHNTKIVQLAEACEHSCLPYLSLFQFSVTQQGVYSEILLVHLCAKCHACCRGNSLSQRTGGHIHAGNMNTGMSLQIGAKMPQSFQILYRKISSVCQCSIKSGCRMTLGQYKTVPVLHMRVFGVNIHLLKIQERKYICCG